MVQEPQSPKAKMDKSVWAVCSICSDVAGAPAGLVNLINLYLTKFSTIQSSIKSASGFVLSKRVITLIFLVRGFTSNFIENFYKPF